MGNFFLCSTKRAFLRVERRVLGTPCHCRHARSAKENFPFWTHISVHSGRPTSTRPGAGHNSPPVQWSTLHLCFICLYFFFFSPSVTLCTVPFAMCQQVLGIVWCARAVARQLCAGTCTYFCPPFGSEVRIVFRQRSQLRDCQGQACCFPCQTHCPQSPFHLFLISIVRRARGVANERGLRTKGASFAL